MYFNVDGEIKELIARRYEKGKSFDCCAEETENLLEDYLMGHKKDLLHKRYKVSSEEFKQWSDLVALHNENVQLHLTLNAEEEKAYEDWEMTRCVNTPEIMEEKENIFLKQLLRNNT